MAEEQRKPWYKKPQWIAVIVGAATVIVSAATVVVMILVRPPREKDFTVSIDPMHGSVQQGGIAQTTVAVKGMAGYDHPVNLSASGQPSDVAVAFSPPFGPATPAYASTMTINVGPKARSGESTIIIKGTGADGKEHTCKYTLIVRTGPVPPVPPPPPEPAAPPPTITITSPKMGEEVPVSTTVTGTFSGELSEGQYISVVINPHPSPAQWWPQGGRIEPWKGRWNVPAWLGREKEDVGAQFDIAVILVNEKDDQYYTNYLKTGQETGNYPGVPLPASAQVVDRITLTRK
ncbi:MAG: hypothetical protein ACYS29_11535 [Planctomycetota bacterium]|jgi:hypothetical protein